MRDQFSRLFVRRNFLHWYFGEGMDNQEFVDSLDSLQEQILKYCILPVKVGLDNPIFSGEITVYHPLTRREQIDCAIRI
ncbi:Beta-tubulin_2 [Hexamita inflata]|uniref:Beta-tubulin 2 n=1 Tax=Hexamita inflata TaxID=28002 RepID=A0AA86PWE6_9EUKA|nr:Beta-tubulin 2 [Hexamita inflata]